MVSAGLLAWRREVYGFLASTFLKPPDEEVFRCVESLAPPPSGSYSGLDPLLADLVRAREQGLQGTVRDFHDLFKVPLAKYVSPYESVYLDTKEVGGDKVGGLMGGESAVRLESLYRKIEFVIPHQFREAPDHVGIELAFMFSLVQEQLGAVERDDEASRRISSRVQHKFLENHLCRWVGSLGKRIAGAAESGFYRCVGRLTAEYCECDLRAAATWGEPASSRA